MRNNNFNDGLGFIGILMGLAGVGYSIYKSRKFDEASKKIDVSVEDIVKKTPVDIQQSIIDKAVEIAVDRAVTAKANATVADIKRDIHSEIEKQVRQEVGGTVETIKERVSKEMNDQIDHIDKDTMLKEVARKVSDELKIEGRKELNHQLTGIVNDLSDNLASYKRVYDGVVGALAPRQNDSGKQLSFRID